MNISEKEINSIIENFKKQKDSIRLSNKVLVNFNKNNKEHVECLSYTQGVGGYYIPFLKHLTEATKPQVIVELGSQTGMSTIALYDAIKKNETGHLYTIDIKKDQRFCPEVMFSDKHVDFIFGDVCGNETIKKLPPDIDLLFTDTLHYDFQLQDEFEIYQHLLADKALVAIDDIRSNDKNVLFDNVPFSKWDLTELCHSSGWGLFLYERKEPSSKEQRLKNLTESMHKVWERKYARLEKELEQKNNTLWKKIKTVLKKLTPIYKIYTIIYNKAHYLFFRDKVLFFER